MSKKPPEQPPEKSPTLVAPPAEPVAAEVDAILQKIPPKDRQVVLQFVQQTSFAGPIAPPDMLEQYDKLIPDGANRMMKLYEAQVAHRHLMESKIVNAKVSLPRNGQIIAATLAIIFSFIGFALAIFGHPFVAGTVFGTTIIGIVTVFVVGRPHKTNSPDAVAAQPKSKRPRR